MFEILTRQGLASLASRRQAPARLRLQAVAADTAAAAVHPAVHAGMIPAVNAGAGVAAVVLVCS